MARFKTGFTLAILGIGISLTMAQQTNAKTFTVEKDGTGDFTVIQNAVDAAASGDTISIGPGRFDDKHYVTSIGWSDSVQVLIPQHELTIIGSGPETIIGQVNSWAPDQGEHKGIVASDYWGNTIIHITNIRFENMRDAVYIAYESSGNDFTGISDCEFYQNMFSLFLIGDGGDLEISNCSFSYMPNSGTLVSASNFGNFTIKDCLFQLLEFFPVSQLCLHLLSIQDASISDCQFFGGSVGAIVTYGGPGSITNCLFDGQRNTAVSPSAGADVVIDSCTFRHQDKVLNSSTSTTRVVMTNSVVEDVSDCTVLMSYFGSLVINNCDLVAGSRGVVYIQDIPNCSVPSHLDMTYNYWGTTDLDSIQALIWDQNDSSEACYYVDYEPFLPISTPTEKKSIGGIKALFR